MRYLYLGNTVRGTIVIRYGDKFAWRSQLVLKCFECQQQRGSAVNT